MTRPTRVLFVAPVEPWCRENGSSVITADLLESLADVPRVDLLPVFIRRPPEGYERRAPAGLDGILLDIEGLPRWVSVLRGAARLTFPLRHRFDNEAVARRLLEIVEERRFRPDVIHVEHLPLVDIGVSLGRHFAAPVVYRAHNVESALWARRLGLPPWLQRPLVRRLERSEADAIAAVEMALMISPGDLAWARERAPSARCELLPPALRLERYQRAGGGDRYFDAQLCFVGGLDWTPNEDGLRWFIAEVLPRIVTAMPGAGLAVLARGANERPWIAEHPRVRIVPAESRAAALFAVSDVSVAPLFQGGGVRIKIPESLAVGCPVVATAIGAEGHALPGLSVADEPRAFARACIEHLRCSTDQSSRDAYRAAVEQCYGADVQAERLVDLWSQCVRVTIAS